MRARKGEGSGGSLQWRRHWEWIEV